MPSPRTIDLSVIITTHAEGILIHHTIASVRRALNELHDKYSYEIILHADNPTPQTNAYIKEHASTSLKDVQIFTNTFGDLGSSRNFAISKAHGRYIATIDADDLMSSNWLSNALGLLEKSKEPTIAHSEVTVEFEGADSLVIKHGEIDRATDTLLSVYANRWNSVIVAPRKLLLEEPYTPNTPGYGYEDWHLNCRLIQRGIHNILVPQTAIFVRRKKSSSEWLRQIQSMAVLRKNPLLAFENIRSLKSSKLINKAEKTMPSLTQRRTIKSLAKRIIKSNAATHRIARYAKIAAKRRQVSVSQTSHFPEWLEAEARAIHDIEKQIFPSRHLMHSIGVYDTITEEHKVAGSLYQQLIGQLNHNRYDYLIFVPWLIKGGADRYTIEYANTIARANKKKRVLVVSTLPVESIWKDHLDASVDFLDFGTITANTSPEIRYRLMEHIIENGEISHIHIINSEFGYDFVRLHAPYITATDRKVIVTSFSQSIDKEGRVFGYSHTHVPFVYDIATLITSDNQAVINMWENEYGFDPKKMVVHRQAIELPSSTPLKSKSGTSTTSLRLLWAARVSFEKQPALVGEIARLLGEKVQIDMFGSIEPEFNSLLRDLPSNVTFRGSFDGFTSLPLKDYDALLYTSLFDGMPNTILEAAQEGIPVIASGVGGIPEFLSDNAGIIVEDIRNPQAYADAIERFITDTSLKDVTVNNAYKKLATDFAPSAYKENINDFLKTIGY
ncbi:MAG TPA: glycosyltransferase [Candidatus Saccharimonadales bacterium]